MCGFPRRALPAIARWAASALAFAAFALPALEASADLLPSGMTRVLATYEVTGMAEHPDYLFVAFPFGACETDEEFYKLNPEHDKALHNYEVLRPGQRYETQKFCSSSKLYAFKASEFKTEPLALPEAFDFYRPKGYTITIIKGFDELKTTEKAKFVAQDKRVKSSSLTLSFPMFLSDALGIESTHDVLRVVSVTDEGLRAEGVKVIIGKAGGATKEVLYTKEGRRPKEAGDDGEDAAPAPQSPPALAPAAAQAGEGMLPFVLAGAGAVSAALLGVALLRRGRSDKKS